MVNRGKDSWNKAMLVDPQGNPSRPNRKMRSSTLEKNARSEDEVMSEKDRSMTHTTKSEKNSKKRTETVPEKNMRNAGGISARNKRTTNAISNNKNTDSSNSGRNRKKTPLEAFDVKAFFEENLYDIIDLEENRSGVREFEDAVKKDE